jgi:YVTN family beta-propeller protein
MMSLVNTASPSTRDPNGAVAPRHRRVRIAVIVASLLAATVGSVLLAGRDSSESTTTRGVTATLQIPGHPGWLAAGPDSLWLALRHDSRHPLGKKPILRLDLATGIVQRIVSVGGEASYITRVGNRLIASVRHEGQDEFGGRLLFAIDWRSGDVLVRRGFDGPVDHLVRHGQDLWALEVRPGALLRLDPVTLAPRSPPLRLSPGQALGLTSGAGSLWVTAADAGNVLRVDPATRAITRVHVGGFPVGIVVAGGSVWYTDHASGEVVRLDPRTLHSVGGPIHVGPNPTWLTAAGGSLFVGDADHGTVTRIDLRSGKKIGAPIRVAPPADAQPFVIAPFGTSVWVSSFASRTVTRIVSTPSRAPSRTVVVSGGEPNSGALPRGGKVIATIPVPAGQGAFAAGEGAVWTMGSTTTTLTRIDPQTNSVVARIELAGPGAEAAAGDGAVWVSHPAQNTVSRIDPSTNTVTTTIPVGPQPSGLAVSQDAVWVANIGDPSVSRIDPATNRVVAKIRVGPPRACCAEHMTVTVGEDAVWVAVPNLNAVVRVDPATNTVTHTVKVPYSPCAFLVADGTAVWSAGGGCGDVLARIDARTNRLTTTVQGDPHPIGLALEFGSLWVAALGSATVDRIDPETGRVVARLPVGGRPIRLAVGFGAIWVNGEGDRVLRIEPQG